MYIRNTIVCLSFILSFIDTSDENVNNLKINGNGKESSFIHSFLKPKSCFKDQVLILTVISKFTLSFSLEP